MNGSGLEAAVVRVSSASKLQHDNYKVFIIIIIIYKRRRNQSYHVYRNSNVVASFRELM